MRIAASKEDAPRVIDRVHDRIADCWRMMDGQIAPRRYILGDELSVLDLYVTVISRFGPWRTRFYQSAPKMAEIVRQVDADPRLEEFWAKRFPFDEVGSGSAAGGQSRLRGWSNCVPRRLPGSPRGVALLAASKLIEL